MTNWQAIKIIATQALFFVLKPFLWCGKQLRAARLRQACAEADRQAEAAKQNRYVVMYNNRFYVYNKGSMMALAKKLHRATHLRVEWPSLYIYKAEWKNSQKK